MSARRAAPESPIDVLPRPLIAIETRAAAWRRFLPRYSALARRAAKSALDLGARALDPGANGELTLVFADDALVRALNRDFRGKDKPTNVLSFSARDGRTTAPGAPLLLGDVVLAYETAAAEAAAGAKPLADHVAHLVVHGVLHLLGYDHVRAAGARRMEALEVRVLARLGVADPYRQASAPVIARHRATASRPPA